MSDVMENDISLRDIPSSVQMKKSSNKKKQHRKKSDEVDAYDNPTELFQWINYGNYEGAILRAEKYPHEVKTWIVSSHASKVEEWEQEIKWRYLPLHLVCLKSSLSEEQLDDVLQKQLLDALIIAYPKGAKERDYHGNLPIHHLLSEGCESLEWIEKLLRAYPESIDVRDGKGRSVFEIISDCYQKGGIKKESMINMLAFLRQWAIGKVQHISKKTQDVHRTGGGKDTRSGSHSSTRYRSSRNQGRKPKRAASDGVMKSESYDDAIKNQERKPKRVASDGVMKSESYDDTIKLATTHETMINNKSFDSIEIRLENTLTERDILRKSVSKLKSEAKNQDLAFIALNQQVERTSSEHQRMKVKVKQKKDKIEELRLVVQEQETRINNHEKIFHEKEKNLDEKDKQINDLSFRVSKLSEENDQVRYGIMHYGGDVDKLQQFLEEVRKENEKLKQSNDEMLQSKLEIEKAVRANEKSYQDWIRSLETKLEKTLPEARKAEAIRADAGTRENRLQSRISILEKELMEVLGKDYDGRLSSLPNFVLVEEEREALQEMNTSLQEHVGSLKERCKQLDETEAINEGLRLSVEQLEKDLKAAHLKQTKYREELETYKSDSLIKESRLQTQLAKVERDLLEERGTKSHTSTGENPEQLKLTEELHAAQLLNSSSQGHIAVMQEKCKVLENNLQKTQEQNDSLCKEILSLKLNTVAVREKEINSDFQQLLSTIQDISASGGAPGIGSEALSILQGENDSLRREINNLRSLEGENRSLRREIDNLASRSSDAQAEIMNAQKQFDSIQREASDLEARNTESQAEIAKLNTEVESLRKLQTELDKMASSKKETLTAQERSDKDNLRIVEKLKAEKIKLEEQNEELIQKQNTSGKETLEAIAELQQENKIVRSQLDELTDAANLYKDKLSKSKGEYEKMKGKNNELRDFISRNNETYLSKVDSMSKELEEIRSVNSSLHAHVLDLSTENEKLRNNQSYEPVKIEEYKEKIGEMTARLNQIAGYLIAVALFVDGEDSGSQHPQQVDDAEFDSRPLSAKKNIRRDEILAEMARRQESILSSEERDDILRNVNGYEQDFRSDNRDSFNFSRQREELNSIAVSLKKIMKQ